MNRYSGLLAIALMVVLCCTSCLGNKDDETSVVQRNDAAITTFVLGTLTRTMHTTSSTGADSTYTVTLAGSKYRFSIDHVGRRIFNADSLPTGTDVKKVLVTIGTYNNSGVYIESLTDANTLTAYSSADSLDLSQPRKLRVVAFGTAQYVTYTLNVNVHQQEGNQFSWSEQTALSAEAQTAFNAQEQQKQSAEQAAMNYVGSSREGAYAFAADGHLVMTTDQWQTWTDEELDGYTSFLPTEDWACVSYDYADYGDMDYVLMIGNRSADVFPQDDAAMVWHKLVDVTGVEWAQKWVYMERPDNNLTKFLPRLKKPVLLHYDDRVLAIGLNGAELSVYETLDGGVTWQKSSIYTLPATIDKTQPVKAVVDDEDYIWMVQETTGKMWRGRLNRMGWGN